MELNNPIITDPSAIPPQLVKASGKGRIILGVLLLLFFVFGFPYIIFLFGFSGWYGENRSFSLIAHSLYELQIPLIIFSLGICFPKGKLRKNLYALSVLYACVGIILVVFFHTSIRGYYEQIKDRVGCTTLPHSSLKVFCKAPFEFNKPNNKEFCKQIETIPEEYRYLLDSKRLQHTQGLYTRPFGIVGPTDTLENRLWYSADTTLQFRKECYVNTIGIVEQDFDQRRRDDEITRNLTPSKASQCDLLNTQDKKDICRLQIAHSGRSDPISDSKNNSLCKDIAECYSPEFMLYNQYRVCDDVVDAEIKKVCRDGPLDWVRKYGIETSFQTYLQSKGQ